MRKNPIIFSRNAGFENIQSMHPFFRKMHFCVKLSVIFLGIFKRFKHLFLFLFADAIMTSAGTEYPMGPLGPPPTGTSSSGGGQPGTFPRTLGAGKKNQCESLSPSFTSISSASSRRSPLSESSSSLSSSNESIVQVASSDNNTGNGYRVQRVAAVHHHPGGSTSGDSFSRDLNSRPRTPRPPHRGGSGSSSTSQTCVSNRAVIGLSTMPTTKTVIHHQKHNNLTTKAVNTSSTNSNCALDIVQGDPIQIVESGTNHPDPNDLQTLSIVASGSVLCYYLFLVFFSF